MPFSQQELIRLHPLYNRLSGQIIWFMFEEQGLSPEQADAFLLQYENERARTLDLLGKALDPGGETTNDVAAVRIEATQPENLPPPCPSCMALDGALLKAGDANLPEFFPPFSLGCRCKAVAVTAAELAAMDDPMFLDASCEPPKRQLVCPTQWFLEEKT